MKRLTIIQSLTILVTFFFYATTLTAQESKFQPIDFGDDWFLTKEPVVIGSFAPSKHYCLFTVDGYKVSLTVYSDTGQILDHVGDLTIIKK